MPLPGDLHRLQLVPVYLSSLIAAWRVDADDAVLPVRPEALVLGRGHGGARLKILVVAPKLLEFAHRLLHLAWRLEGRHRAAIECLLGDLPRDIVLLRAKLRILKHLLLKWHGDALPTQRLLAVSQDRDTALVACAVLQPPHRLLDSRVYMR